MKLCTRVGSLPLSSKLSKSFMIPYLQIVTQVISRSKKMVTTHSFLTKASSPTKFSDVLFFLLKPLWILVRMLFDSKYQFTSRVFKRRFQLTHLQSIFLLCRGCPSTPVIFFILDLSSVCLYSFGSIFF